jgi:NADH-ubiquinone oxidoreductase chain 5
MIVSGVFLLQRFQPLFLGSFFCMFCITVIGGLTSFFAGTVGLLAMDLKRIIAYSTCSQMGYLVFCVGVGNTNISFFHLFNHAFFKCLLFVSAGTIIHAFMNNQDIRKMGGVLKGYPFIYILILIASLSLMGLPFFSGYYSKEKILEYSFYTFNSQNVFSFWFGSISALFTALYSMRLLFYVFFKGPNSLKNNYELVVTKVVNYLNLVLILLGLGSVFSGFLLEDLVIGFGNDWNVFTTNLMSLNQLDIHLGNTLLNYVPFFYTCFGFIFSYIIIFENNSFQKYLLFSYIKISVLTNNISVISKLFKSLILFLGNRWYLNLGYNRYFAKLSFSVGYNITFILLDKGLFELPHFISTRFLSGFISILSSKFYRNFSFSDLLFNLIIALISFILFNILNNINFISFYFAVPRKKVNSNKYRRLISIKKHKTLSFFLLRKSFTNEFIKVK